MHSDRIKQEATRRLFKAASKYATNVPIIVVATKSDEFKHIKAGEGFDLYADSGLKATEQFNKAREYAGDQIQNRLSEIESEMLKVEGGRFDGCVAVNQGDKDSIQNLNQITWESFNQEKVRLMYIAAQTTNIDMKIDLAIMETMRVYRNVIGSASCLGLVPGASSANRTAAAYKICKVIVKSFGLPTLDSKTIIEIVKANVWDDLGHNVSVFFAEGIATLGVLASVLFAGMPIFLGSGALNLPLVVPATTRLMLLLAGDLILILSRAFKTTTFTCVGQPLFADVRQAAVLYRSISSHVHKKILGLVRRRNLVDSYRYNKVGEGLRNIIGEYKNQATEDVASRVPAIIGVRPNTLRQKDVVEVRAEITDDVQDILPSYAEASNVAQSNGIPEAVEKYPLSLS
ncbi:MAG: hypothetical protein Q9160_001479 [Pyrenula sp. 1 TL-2023]